MGETVQNANLINAGRIEEKIADLIPDNSTLIASYPMPSNRYIDLTLGASGTLYTAPANGWFCCNKLSSGTRQYLNMHNAQELTSISWSTGSGDGLKTYLPVKKGDVINIEYSAGGSIEIFRFIYAEGEQ